MRYTFPTAILTIALGVAVIGRVMGGGLNTASAKSASELYAKHCASCHGKDGRAKTFKAKFNNARDLTDRAWQDDVSNERLFNSIMNGKGKKMPAFGKKLSEQEIEALVAYVRNFKK